MMVCSVSSSPPGQGQRNDREMRHTRRGAIRAAKGFLLHAATPPSGPCPTPPGQGCHRKGIVLSATWEKPTLPKRHVLSGIKHLSVVSLTGSEASVF